MQKIGPETHYAPRKIHIENFTVFWPSGLGTERADIDNIR